jgi:hypothetical protein
MARRSTPDRIYQANRAGTVRRLEAEGLLRERAEALVTAWECEAGDGLRSLAAPLPLRSAAADALRRIRTPRHPRADDA